MVPLSNALTGLTILPACIVAGVYAAQRRFPRPSRARVVEGAAIAAGLVLSGAIAFLIPAGVRWQLALRLYAPLPVLIWAALRFGTGAVSLGLTATLRGSRR